MARRNRASRGGSSVPSGEWGTYAIGVLTGALAIGGVWLASTRGVALNWPILLSVTTLCAAIGFGILKWPKAKLDAGPRRSLETVGFMLMGPFIIALALCLFYTILPSDFAPRTDLLS